MQPQARVLLDLIGDKSYYLWNGTESYYSKLRSAYKEILNNNESDYLYFAFTILCASTLEYSLNYILTDYCINTFGSDNYKENCDRYIDRKFRTKLLNIPSIVSNGQYYMNEKHTSFIVLEELIILRNRILHNKESLNEFDCPINGELEGDCIYIPLKNSRIEFELPIETNYIDSLTKEKCLAFGNDIGDFK